MEGNFYSWMSGCPGSVAMDAEVMRKHPDGSPCYAKKEEDCPILNKAKKVDEADALNVSSTPERRHLSELYEKILPQVRELVPNGDSIDYSTLEEAYEDFKEEATGLKEGDYTPASGSRERRNEIYEMHKDDLYASFDLVTGKKVTDADGKWGVTFHTTSAEAEMDNRQYDDEVGKYEKVFSARPQVGVYEGACEISYCCGSLTKALAGLVYCEQKGIFGFMKAKNAAPDSYGIDIVNTSFDTRINNLSRPTL